MSATLEGHPILSSLHTKTGIKQDPHSPATLEPNSSAAATLPTSKLSPHTSIGINPLVDAASQLFTMMGYVRNPAHANLDFAQLHEDLRWEISAYQDKLAHLDYAPEQILICCYLVCASLDDIISHLNATSQSKWAQYSLLKTLQPEGQQSDQFFILLEHALKDPTSYIDILEFMYLCLSLGYKGPYRGTEYNLYRLEQINTSIYHHIQAQRGFTTKRLSPSTAYSLPKQAVKPIKATYSFITPVLLSLCLISALYTSLSYQMDVISNETYSHIVSLEKPLLSSSR
jgi:type VI secretion system protein ImpK